MKDEKDLLESGKSEQNTQDKDSSKKAEKRRLTKQAVMALVSGIIVVVVLIAVGIAWYTRIVNSYSVTFEVADYDLAINNSPEELKLNVYEYSQVTNKKMAPGTVGWIPLDISAKYSQVDVMFTIAVENLMPEYIAKHFRIFALKEAKVDGGTVTYNSFYYGDALRHEADMYAKIVVGEESVPRFQKYYLDSMEDDVISDVMTKGNNKILCIYWEWYFDADRANADHEEDGFTFYYDNTNKKTWINLTPAEQAAAKILWDDLDTDIGRYPAKYKDAMQMVLHTTGAQARPANGVKKETDTETKTETKTETD